MQRKRTHHKAATEDVKLTKKELKQRVIKRNHPKRALKARMRFFCGFHTLGLSDALGLVELASP